MRRDEARRDYIRCQLLRGSPAAPKDLEERLRKAEVQMNAETCPDCGGTVLDYSVAGVERGTCHCPKPGEIIARLFYGVENNRKYSVRWFDIEIPVEPPTLTHAVQVLNELRSSLRASQGDPNVQINNKG